MIIPISDVNSKKEYLLSEIKKGSVFIYPTDTIYGIGCDASNENSVLELRALKERYDKPFSVIAPSKEWIYKNCFVRKAAAKYIERLPGAFTFVLNLKKRKNNINKYVNMDMGTIGVRIPLHPFSDIIKESGKPFVTTSVNIAGRDYAMSVEEMPEKIKENCIIIDAGIIEGKPSALIDLTGKMPKILQR